MCACCCCQTPLYCVTCFIFSVVSIPQDHDSSDSLPFRFSTVLEMTSKANCGHWYLHEVELSQLHDPLGTEPPYIAKETLTEFLLGKEDRPQKASPAIC